MIECKFRAKDMNHNWVQGNKIEYVGHGIAYIFDSNDKAISIHVNTICLRIGIKGGINMWSSDNIRISYKDGSSEQQTLSLDGSLCIRRKPFTINIQDIPDFVESVESIGSTFDE